MEDISGPALILVLAGFVGGLVLFVRGLVAYRHDRLISSVATSSLDGIAAGEVRVSGIVEAIDGTLVSPLQSRPCIWYRARVEEAGENGRTLLAEERSREFRVANETGSIRVIPRGARWEVRPVFDGSTSIMGAEPAGLHARVGTTLSPHGGKDPELMTELERQAAAQALLTVQRPAGSTLRPWQVKEADWRGFGGGLLGGSGGGIGLTREGGKRYREARVEPGQTVTIVGQALPWADVRDMLHAWEPQRNVEDAIADDIARAREAGLLAASPEEAWGNAAIPGFGIGQPTQAPSLDPDARQPQPVGPEAYEEAMSRYDIPAEELVLSRGHGVMAVYLGSPQLAVAHHDLTFILGLIGAVMAVVCALGLGAALTGTL